MTRPLPAIWDLEAEVVAIGSGGGGLSAAITAHDHGASSLVLERTDQVGGVTAYSLGEVWVPGNHHAAAMGIEDSAESGFRYVQRLSMGYGDDVAILNQAVHAPVVLRYFEDTIGLRMMVVRCPDYYYGYSNDSLAEGRLLEVEPFAAEQLGEWQTKTRVSPHVLYGMTHEDIFENGGSANLRNWDFSVMGERLAKDERCLGPGLIAYFVKGALDRGIPLHTGVTAKELLRDGDRVVGVYAVNDAGEDLYVKANRGVVLAVSSYERSPRLTRTLGQQLDVHSVLMPAVDGAHIRLAGKLGARVARVPDLTMLGFQVPGEELQEGVPLWRNAMAYMGLPHTIVVNRSAKRFANESFYRSIYFALDQIDGETQTHPNFPCWAIFDAQARAKYPFGSIMPGEPLPAAVGVTADTLEELAGKIGISADALLQTVNRFNAHSETGTDPDFGRGSLAWGAYMSGDRFHKPSPNLGPLTQGPFYAVELQRLASSGIASAGIVVDEHSRAIDWEDQPIEGLYLAGNSVARLDNGALMQSGISNARGMTQGYLAGRHAAGKPSTLLASEMARMGLAK